jgi:hypothetical protein
VDTIILGTGTTATATSTSAAAIAAITDRDADATSTRYRHTRIVEIGGRTVRARVERDVYLDLSGAIAEVLTDQGTWSSLAADAPNNWYFDTPPPSPDIDAAAVLAPLTEALLDRSAANLAAPPSPTVVSPHVHGAISALLASMCGFDSEHRVDPDDIVWASTHGGRLHIFELPDGSVTFTKAHREDCPLITSGGAVGCDDECYFEHPSRLDGRSTS